MYFYNKASGSTTGFSQQFDAAVVGKKIIGYGIHKIYPAAAGWPCSTMNMELSLSGTVITLSVTQTDGGGHFTFYEGAVQIVVYYIDV